jgi:hypothetical protein
MGMIVCIHGQQIAAFFDVQPKLAVKMAGDRKIWHGEVKTIERMDAKLSGTPARLDVALDRCHRFLPSRRRRVAT